MAKNSETLYRVAATFQGGRDPDQDAVIRWLNTLPKNEKGQLHRSTLKYHVQRAFLHYIASGLTNSQTPLAGAHLAAPAAAPVVSPPPAVAPRAAVVDPGAADSIPVLTDAVASPPAAAPAAGGAKVGGALRNRIKNSMNTSNTGE